MVLAPCVASILKENARKRFLCNRYNKHFLAFHVLVNDLKSVGALTMKFVAPMPEGVFGV